MTTHQQPRGPGLAGCRLEHGAETWEAGRGRATQQGKEVKGAARSPQQAVNESTHRTAWSGSCPAPARHASPGHGRARRPRPPCRTTQCRHVRPSVRVRAAGGVPGRGTLCAPGVQGAARGRSPKSWRTCTGTQHVVLSGGRRRQQVGYLPLWPVTRLPRGRVHVINDERTDG